MLHKKITFIGAGNMASSIISGLVKDGYPSDAICASEPNKEATDKLATQFSIKGSQDNTASAKWAEVIVLAVKPQIMGMVCQTLAETGVDFSNKTGYLYRSRHFSKTPAIIIRRKYCCYSCYA